MDITSLISDSVTTFSGYLRTNKIIRVRLIWACLIAISIAMTCLAALAIHPLNINGIVLDHNNIGPFLIAPSAVAFALLLVAGMSYLDPDRPSTEEGELKEAYKLVSSGFLGEKRSRAATGRGKEKERDEGDIFYAIGLNLKQVAEYYVINKGQAKRSFQMSVVAIIVGFLTIIAGIWLSYGNQLTNQNPAYISVLAGVVLQFIGGAYFYLYNRSLIQLNFFFSRLALMQDTMLAIRLCDSIPEGHEKHHVLEQLIFQIVTRNSRVPEYLKETKTEQAESGPTAKPARKPNPVRTKKTANAA